MWCVLIQVTDLARQLLTSLSQEALPSFLVLRSDVGDQPVPVALPSEILELLPPPPSGGWPGDGAWSSSRRVLAKYPAARRAQRLSFCIAALLPSLERQPLLEARSTVTRLQLELEMLREMLQKLRILVALRSSQVSVEGIGGEDDGYPSATG